MAHNKTEVRKILDKVKAEGRTSLTAPEGKLVATPTASRCRRKASRPPPPKRRSSRPAWAFRWCSRSSRREILHKTEAGGVLVGVKTAEEVEKGFATIMANAKKYDAQGRRSSACRCSRCSAAARK